MKLLGLYAWAEFDFQISVIQYPLSKNGNWKQKTASFGSGFLAKRR
jgi:hypothetical protein